MKFEKTLVMSWCVPPAPTGSAIIVENLVKQFSPDEMVVVGSFYVNSPQFQWEAEFPKLVYATVQPPDGWRGTRFVRWAQLPLIILVSMWIIVSHQCQNILAVYPDQIYLFAAYLVHLISRKSLFLYFHNTYAEAKGNGFFARWLQQRVFSRAKHVFVMSEGMQRLYNNRYPWIDCTPLVHTFNEPLSDPDETSLEYLSEVRLPLNFAISGNFNASNSGAAKNLAQVLRNLPDSKTSIYTGTSTAYLERLGFVGSHFSVAKLNRESLLKRLQEADILLLPHGFSESIAEEEIQTIFPTRTIEYLICGRPILAHLPEGCFLYEFLQRHDCALTVTDQNSDSLLDAIERLKQDDDLRRKLVYNSLRVAHQFRASEISKELRDTLSMVDLRIGPDKSGANCENSSQKSPHERNFR